MIIHFNLFSIWQYFICRLFVAFKNRPKDQIPTAWDFSRSLICNNVFASNSAYKTLEEQCWNLVPQRRQVKVWVQKPQETVDQAWVRHPRHNISILLLVWMASPQEASVYRALLSACGKDNSKFAKNHSFPLWFHSQPPLQFTGTIQLSSDQCKVGRSDVWLFQA